MRLSDDSWFMLFYQTRLHMYTLILTSGRASIFHKGHGIPALTTWWKSYILQAIINVASEQEINPLEGSLRKRLTGRKRCVGRIKVRWVFCADVNFHHSFSSSASEIANLYGENNWNKQGRGWGGTPHPELRTHSACQYSLSCCIFYEENSVAYYNIYRHLKIAKWVFLLLGSVTFAHQPRHGVLFHIR